MAHRVRLVPFLVALAVLGVLVVPLPAGASLAAFSTTLNAYVTQDGFIGINFADGTPIGKTLPAGAYTVNVDDQTDIHQFHLFGPGVDKETDIDGVGKQVWTVTFQAGANYSYQCDLHAVIMFGQFSVTAAGSTASSGSSSGGSTSSGSSGTTGSSSSASGSNSTSQDQSNASVVGSTAAVASKAFRGSLDAVVFSSGKLSLSRFGKNVSSLKSGRYTFSVDDESKHGGFTVQRLRTAPVHITSPAFVGSRDVTIPLAPGQWFFDTPGGKKTYFIVTR
jgi:hypothetical protein